MTNLQVPASLNSPTGCCTPPSQHLIRSQKCLAKSGVIAGTSSGRSIVLLNQSVAALCQSTRSLDSHKSVRKSNFADHMIITTKLQRTPFRALVFFLRWKLSLQQVDFGQGFVWNNILRLVAFQCMTVFFTFLCTVSVYIFCGCQDGFCHLEIQIY